LTASSKILTLGSGILVEGRVTDVSAGRMGPALASRFPNGVPAVSDANMSEWLLYLYKQFARPSDVSGVEVVLTVLDPNTMFLKLVE
jgi:hypothetical protein